MTKILLIYESSVLQSYDYLSLTSVQLYSNSCPLVTGDFVGFIDSISTCGGDGVGDGGEVSAGGGVGVRDTDEGCDRVQS